METMRLTLREKARVFKALSEEKRLEILRHLTKKEFCVSDVARALDMSASVASHHLKVLESVYLLDKRKEGKNVIFKVNIDLLEKLFEDLHVFLKS